MKRWTGWLAGSLAVFTVLSSGAAGRETGASSETPSTATVLVVPTKPPIVQLAFDVAWIRPAYIVAYDRNAKTRAVRLHAWNHSASDWVEIDEGRYAAGQLYRSPPDRVFVIGEDSEVPPVIAMHPSWATEMIRIPTLSLVTIVNTLNQSLRFSAEEWQWLARRNGLKLEDQNLQRRRYGRYGAPEKERKPGPESDLSEAIRMELVEPIAVVPAAVSAPAPAPAAAPEAVPTKGLPVPAPAAAPAPATSAPAAPDAESKALPADEPAPAPPSAASAPQPAVAAPASPTAPSEVPPPAGATAPATGALSPGGK